MEYYFEFPPFGVLLTSVFPPSEDKVNDILVFLKKEGYEDFELIYNGEKLTNNTPLTNFAVIKVKLSIFEKYVKNNDLEAETQNIRLYPLKYIHENGCPWW